MELNISIAVSFLCYKNFSSHFLSWIFFSSSSRPVKQSSSPPLQKALSLAYDGDVDM